MKTKQIRTEAGRDYKADVQLPKAILRKADCDRAGASRATIKALRQITSDYIAEVLPNDRSE